MCPVCEALGEEIPYETVCNLVKPDKKVLILDKGYYICLNPSCNVAYYCDNNKDTFITSDISVPIWYKDDANIKYVCYCNNVTIDEVTNTIIDYKVKNIKGLMKYTNVMKNGQCKKNHPMGKCCSFYLNKLIEEYWESTPKNTY